MSKSVDDFVLYLVSIKQAYENGEMSDADCGVLKALFEHGVLYHSLLENETLCNDKTRNSISDFCQLIEEMLPAPEITGDVLLSLELVAGDSNKNKTDSLTPDILARASEAFVEVVIDLMSILQMAILDLSLKLKEANTLSAVDIENTNYVIGMAEITSSNFGAVLNHVGHFENAGYEAMQKFFVDGTRFAASLQQSGLGVA